MHIFGALSAAFCLAGPLKVGEIQSRPVVTVSEGKLEGAYNAATSIYSFKGVPFAAPPVGPLRWREPQPALPWVGIKVADKFGPKAMQPAIYSDMVFRSNGMSEDCLYLNVWSPNVSRNGKLPVLVYFYGGGFVAGDTSEPRYDGENMSRQGIVVVTVNYRLGIFGFFTHPELTSESPNHACGNYGLLDQSAALNWVSQNIAAFGGDPKKITIAGESAGSYSVSAQMASPLSRKLLVGAIGESGAIFGRTLTVVPRADAEKKGVQFAKDLGAKDIRALREIPSEKLLTLDKNPFQFGLCLDGYFLPKTAEEIYEAGEQAQIRLLAGWNSWESGFQGIVGNTKPTPETLEQGIRRLYPNNADEAVKLYAAKNDEEALTAAVDLASDRFISFGTWKWIDLQSKTGKKPVYRYLFTRPRPSQPGAVHSAEIEYALGNLDGNTVYKWQREDRDASRIMMQYFANFIKSGNPNGAGLTPWEMVNRKDIPPVMVIDSDCKLITDGNMFRYKFLDRLQYPSKPNKIDKDK